ncbi:dethiobiotin synthase [Halosquirtibacter laminarini]|uniref:Dethiobiotin synthase n=1 Tax=Halosquirtibacter laminarini TaxID=3374600 RepID=A0AC61NMZ2_9BACT|nr:dethiobiotin synthase [Prolixibacteraceae bacterium]
MGKTFFISGIDTDCGKTIATGILAKSIAANGTSIITQKFVQTGCTDFSEDITKHREVMGIDPTIEDLNHTTAPIIFSTPVSPHLASEIDKRELDIKKVYASMNDLEEKYEYNLLEGAGGLMVPITRSYNTLDFIKDSGIPLILVSSSKLGSINHTLISLELIKHYQINLKGVLYNHLPDTHDLMIRDSARVIKTYLKDNFPESHFIEIPDISKDKDFTIPIPVVKLLID